MAERFVLEVLNPRNAMKTLTLQGLPPRVETLDGKRIALILEKPDGIPFLKELQKLLEERHPTSTIRKRCRITWARYPSPASICSPSSTMCWT